MSVFTCVDRPGLEAFLRHYHLGSLLAFEGIPSGVENTNYFVTTSTGEYVLTVFETVGREDIPFFLRLTAFLAEHGLPCAHPVADRDNRYMGELCGKPAALVGRLPGRSVEVPAPEHCAQVGEVLAELHAVGADFPHRRENARGPAWRARVAGAVAGLMPAQDSELLADELAYQSPDNAGGPLAGLPAGVIHADLFTDNVLFREDRLCGLIDFYYACNDTYLYDLAITVNDWCSLADGSLDTARAGAMVHAYHARRPLLDAEGAAWCAALRAAALRFWLSRLHDKLFPRDGEVVQVKDPDVLKHILLARRRCGDDALSVWPSG